jgi:hypothetical protein
VSSENTEEKNTVNTLDAHTKNTGAANSTIKSPPVEDDDTAASGEPTPSSSADTVEPAAESFPKVSEQPPAAAKADTDSEGDSKLEMPPSAGAEKEAEDHPGWSESDTPDGGGEEEEEGEEDEEAPMEGVEEEGGSNQVPVRVVK